MVKYNPSALARMQAAGWKPGRGSERLDHIFQALSDGTRRDILSRLAGRPHTVSELAKPHRMSLPAVSKHIGILEDIGLVRRERQGRRHIISLRAKPMKQAAGWIERYRVFWEEAFDTLEEFLRQNP